MFPRSGPSRSVVYSLAGPMGGAAGAAGGPEGAAARLQALRRTLALSRGGKVQFIVDPVVQWAAPGSLGRGECSSFIPRERRILLDPAAADAPLLRDLARHCFAGNVERYKARFRTLALIEKVPGVRGLWSRIIDTMTDAVVEDLVALGVPGCAELPPIRPSLDRDQTAAETIQEILEVVNHGIDGYVRRQAQREPVYRARIMALFGEEGLPPRPVQGG